MRLYNTESKFKKSTVFLYTVLCCAQSLHSCPTLRPMDCSPPGSCPWGFRDIKARQQHKNKPKNHYTPENRLKDPQQNTVNSIQRNTWRITHHDPPGSSVHGDSPGKNTGVSCCALLQGTLPTQELNSYLQHLLHCRQVLYSLRRSPYFYILEINYWK